MTPPDIDPIGLKRQEIRQRKLDILKAKYPPRKFAFFDTVEALEPIETEIRRFDIPAGTKGRVTYVGRYYECYDVEFVIHEERLTASCLSHQLKRSGHKLLNGI